MLGERQASVGKITPAFVCESLNVQADLKEKKLRKPRRQFSYESPEGQLTDSLKKLEVSFFNVVINNANVARSHPREIRDIGKTGENFRVLSTFSTLSNKELTDECAALISTRQCDGL